VACQQNGIELQVCYGIGGWFAKMHCVEAGLDIIYTSKRPCTTDDDG
jgi:hypothetical protein